MILQRILWIGFLSVFCFWYVLVPFVLKNWVRSQTGCELVFCEISLKWNKLILDDVLLLDRNRESSLRIKQAQISFAPFNLSLIHPHLFIRESGNFFSFKNKNKKSKKLPLTIHEGTYEWGKKDPLSGTFSMSPEQGLIINGSDGTLRALVQPEGEIDLFFFDWKISHFLEHEVKGTIQGELHLSQDNKIRGHLRCEEIFCVIPEKELELGATLWEWGGEISHVEQLIALFSEKTESLLEKLSKNEHQIKGNARFENLFFNHKGKKTAFFQGFCSFDEYGRFESYFHFGEARGALCCDLYKQKGSLEFTDFNLRELNVFQGLFFIPLESVHFKNGLITSRIEWEKNRWNLQHCSGKDFEIQGEGWSICSEQITTSLEGEGFNEKDCIGVFSFQGTKGVISEFVFSDLMLQGKIDQGVFANTQITLESQGVEIRGVVEGEVLAPKALCDIKGFSLIEQGGSLELSFNLFEGTFLAEVLFSQFKIPCGSISEIAAEVFFDLKRDLIECTNLTGVISIGSFRVPLRGLELKKLGEEWFFDLRCEHSWFDFLRLKGILKKTKDYFEVEFDPVATQILDIPLQMQECKILSKDLQSFRFVLETPWSFWSRYFPKEKQIHEFLFDQVNTLPLIVEVNHDQEKWNFSELSLGPLTFQGCLIEQENRWCLEGGKIQWNQSCSFGLSGSFCSSFIECTIDQMSLVLKEGIFKGKGAFEWKEGAGIEGDFTINPTSFKKDDWILENRETLQVHYSKREGALFKGLDLLITYKQASSAQARIGIVQFDDRKNHWVFDHVQSSISGSLFQQIFPYHFIDLEQELTFSGSFDYSENESLLTGSFREAIVPLFQNVWNVHDLEFVWNSQQVVASFLTDLDLECKLCINIHPNLHGRVSLADLHIDWGIDPEEGWCVYSLDGYCRGIEASFHKEMNTKNLLGSLRFHSIPDFFPLPQLIQDLKLGKGYELKGRFSFEPWSFKGILSGKSCEILGFQIRTLLTQIDLSADRLYLFDVSASDPAGIVQIPSLTIDHHILSIPLLRIQDFRPSLLQKLDQTSTQIAPFVIRDLVLTNLHGSLENANTFTAQGRLSFINSFKNEHTIFDLPSDFLGRIFGLDYELLVPVQGDLTLELNEGNFWLTNLENSYSQGKRSEFFLIHPSTIGLDGKLNILVKMKQYVLFKITEHFHLAIEGTIENPSGRLRRKYLFNK